MKEVLNLLPVDKTKNYLNSVGQLDKTQCPTDALPKNIQKTVGRHSTPNRAGANAGAGARLSKQARKKKIQAKIAKRSRSIRDFINGVKILAPKVKNKDPYFYILHKAIEQQLSKPDYKLFYDLVLAFTIINSNKREQLTPTMYLTQYTDYSLALKMLKWKNEPRKELTPKSYRKILAFIAEKYGDKPFFFRSIEMNSTFANLTIKIALNYYTKQGFLNKISRDKYQLIRFDFKL